MAIIEFPKPKIPLTEEETHEYWELKNMIEEAATLRQILIVRKKTKNFIKRVNERHYGKNK